MNIRRNGKGRYPRLSNLSSAAYFICGVSQTCRSTPAVRLPRFSVTRLTANALAENERVSHLCRAFTLRQLPDAAAFASRICMTLTFRWTFRQSMAIQSVGACEAAELSCVQSVTLMLNLHSFALPLSPFLSDELLWPVELLTGPLQLLTTTTPRGSLHPFRSGQISNPYPGRYSPAFAFSTIPYPLPQQLPLRVTCHLFSLRWRRIGLTTFPSIPKRRCAHHPLLAV